MAEALSELGVDVMEAGFAIASPGDFESVQSIAQQFAKDGPVVASLGRANPADILRSGRGAEARRAQAHPHRARHLRPAHAGQAAHEPGGGAGPDHLQRHAGAASMPTTWNGRPRTAAAPTPTSSAAASRPRSRPAPPPSTSPTPSAMRCRRTWRRIFRDAAQPGARGPRRSSSPRTTTTTSAWRWPIPSPPSRPACGRSRCTINGIGERAGNASLEEVAMALRTRRDALPYTQRHRHTRSILKTCKLLATITGFDVQPNKAIVGRNAFAHESGHPPGRRAEGCLDLRDHDAGERRLDHQQPGAGQAFRPGRLPRQAGRRWATTVGDNQLNDAFRRFKDLADRKKVVYDEDIVALVDDEVVRGHDRVKLLALTVATGIGTKPMATLALEVDGERARRHGDRRRRGGCHLQRHPPGLPA